jgi:microcystin degradation protein MlrC
MRDDFDGRIYSPDEGVQLAMELAKSASKPIIIADTQDNPGAGGDSDTTGMLRALVRNRASAATGVIYDPQSARPRMRPDRRHPHAGARRQVRHSR